MSGTKQTVDYYIEQFNYCRLMGFPPNEDPHVICSVMKMYLNQFPEPVLTKRLGSIIIRAFSEYENNPTEEKKQELIIKIQENCIRLQKSHRKLLLALLNLAILIASQSHVNKMDEENIGKIFGPCVYWRTDMSLTSLNEVNTANALFTFMMRHLDSFVEILLDEK